MKKSRKTDHQEGSDRRDPGPLSRPDPGASPAWNPTRDGWHLAVLEHAACILFVLDPQARVILCNRKAREVTGFGREELEGKRFLELLAADDGWGGSETDLLDQALASPVEVRLELPLRRRKGSPVTTSFGLARISSPEGGEPATVCVGTDITQVRRKEEDLKRSERRAKDAFRQLAVFSRISSRILHEGNLDQVCMLFIEAIRDHSVFSRAILTLIDEEGKGYLWYFTGLTDEEIEEFHRNKLTDRQRASIFQERFRLGNSYYIPHGSGWRYQGVPSKVPKARAGDWHPDDFLFIPLYGPNRRLVGMVSVDDPLDGKIPTPESLSPLELFANQVAHCIEKTHLDHKVKESLRKLELAKEQLVQAEKLSAIGELVSGVAHELNNPLTGVMGYAQLLLGADCSQKVKRDLERIHREATRCQKIVQNLLMFARRRKAERRYDSINEILNSTLELREYQLRVDNIQVVKQLDENLPKTMVDFYQLQQVFLNLINNAHQAMTEAHGRGTLTITTRAVGGRIRVEVRDTGPGIPKEHLGRIFDPFFTTKEVGKGTGLGLSLSYGIIQEHEGTIRAESRPGRETVFTVELPIREEQEPEEEAASTPRGSGRGGRSILVVDDEEIIVDLLRDILTTAGHRVDVARNGMEAMSKILANGYDLILSDLKMPGMSGEDLYEQVRRERPEFLPKIVFSTGEIVSPEVQRFLKETRNRYLTKPFSLEEILDTVREVLRN